MHINQLLAQGNWVFAHKTLIKRYDSDTAIIVGYLCSLQETYQDWFYCTYEKMNEELGISTYTIKTSIQKLIDDEILITKREGMPCKTYYYLDEKNLSDVFYSDGHHRGLVLPKTYGLVLPKTYGHNKNINNKNNNIKKINNKKNSSEKMERTKTNEIDFECSKEYVSILKKWFRYKREKGQSYKSKTSRETVYKQLRRFSNSTPSIAKQIVERSICNNWAGLFPLEKENKQVSGTHGTHATNSKKIDYSQIKVTKISQINE